MRVSRPLLQSPTLTKTRLKQCVLVFSFRHGTQARERNVWQLCWGHSERLCWCWRYINNIYPHMIDEYMLYLSLQLHYFVTWFWGENKNEGMTYKGVKDGCSWWVDTTTGSAASFSSCLFLLFLHGNVVAWLGGGMFVNTFASWCFYFYFFTLF